MTTSEYITELERRIRILEELSYPKCRQCQKKGQSPYNLKLIERTVTTKGREMDRYRCLQCDATICIIR